MSQTTIEFDADHDPTADSPDIWVDEIFVNEYGDERAFLDGDTYDAKDTIKFDWETTHHKFHQPSSRWMVDADSLDALEEKLTAAGFTLDRTQSDGPDTDGPLFKLADIAAEGDRIAVEYWQKNGEGTNTKEGEVSSVTTNSGYEDKPQVNFYRDDEQGMYVQFDKFGKVSLYTAHSQAPFVGKVKAVTVETDAEVTEADDAPEPCTDGGMTQLALSAIADMEADE